METVYQGLGRAVSAYKRYLSVFAQKLQEAYPKIPIQMERLCYLVRIHVKPSRLSMLLNHSNISVLRKRLYLKMSGKTGKASDFDLYINDL